MTSRQHRALERDQPRCSRPRPNGRGKQGFRSAAKAKQAAVEVRGKAGHPLYVYECGRCGLWHLTGMPQSKGGGAA